MDCLFCSTGRIILSQRKCVSGNYVENAGGIVILLQLYCFRVIRHDATDMVDIYGASINIEWLMFLMAMSLQIKLRAI